MAIKDKVLELLDDNKGKYLSGDVYKRQDIYINLLLIFIRHFINRVVRYSLSSYKPQPTACLLYTSRCV